MVCTRTLVLMDSRPHGISFCAGCRVVGPDFPAVSGSGTLLFSALFCCRPLVQRRCQRLYRVLGSSCCQAPLLSLHCIKVPSAACEHVFVLTLQLTRLITFRPPLVSALFVASTVCVELVSVLVCVYVLKAMAGMPTKHRRLAISQGMRALTLTRSHTHTHTHTHTSCCMLRVISTQLLKPGDRATELQNSWFGRIIVEPCSLSMI